jgi:Protein of unknown function (DUF4013)
MNVTELIKDSLKYPISDWKKIIVLGIIIVIGGLSSLLNLLGVTNYVIILIFFVIGLISGLMANGYLFKIIKTSLENENKLPEFNDWKNLLIDGVKVFLTFIVYLILPPFVIFTIILLLTGGLSSLGLDISALVGSLGTNPLSFFATGVLSGIENLFILAFNILNQLVIVLLIEFLIILPLFLVAIANMAYEREFSAAFRLREIIEIIEDIGWANLIKWYITTGVIFLLIFSLGTLISFLFSITSGSVSFYIISLLLALILLPYSQIYYVRAVALFYKPE